MTGTGYYLQDVTLRDGMHAVGHAMSRADVVRIAAALDAAGVDAVEVAHGDGLGGSTLTYGPAAESTLDLIEAAAGAMERAVLTTLLIPGIGTVADLVEAHQRGARSVRVATHCTEADVAAEHVERARELGMDVSGFLMMSHMTSPAALARQASLMASYGAHCVYVTDSAGHLTPRGVSERVGALVEAVGPDVQVGIHAHQNLSLAVANSLAALDAGAWRVDASLAGLGAGAGNTPIEPFVAAAALEGLEHGADLLALEDAADDLVRPMLGHGPDLTGEALTLGYAGVYSSFLLHARAAGERFGVDPRQILTEVGRRQLVGGQEDLIVDVALEMAATGGAR